MVKMKRLDSEILREVGALSRNIQTTTDGRFKKDGLKKGQYIFITRICENEGISLVELTQLLKVDKTTTTKAVQKLIDAGFIEKKRDSLDKRIWNLYPRMKAVGLYPLIIAEENRNIGTCYNGFDEEEMETVCRLIKKMRGNLEAHRRCDGGETADDTDR